MTTPPELDPIGPVMPPRHTIVFWLLVVAGVCFVRSTYAETPASQKPHDWNEPANIRAILSDAEQSADIPRGLAHVVAYHESRFNPRAQSKYVAGYRSRGLMQIYFKYQSAIVSRHSSIGHTNFIWYDPEHSAIVGCGYLSYLINRFGGSVYLGVLAYNWGEGNVERMTSMEQIPDNCKKYTESVLRMLDEWDETW